MKKPGTRNPIVLIKSSEIKKNFSMLEAVNAMEEAFASLSGGKCFVPQRYVTTAANGNLHLLLKPASIDSDKKAAIKILTQKEQGMVNGIPTIVGVVLLLDTESGEILSIMDGEYLTALRTGAASGLATKYFARKNAEIAAIFGCGAQGKTQLEAVVTTRNISKVWIFEPRKEVAEQFLGEMQQKLNINIQVAPSTRVLKECDVICTATNAQAPLFKRHEVKEGVHINAIGSFKPNMQELDPQLLKRAKIYVDQIQSCLAESGDLIKPINLGIFSSNHVIGEIGQFALNQIEGRSSEKDTTVFKSVGVAIQDYVVANKIYQKSRDGSFGQTISLFE